DDELPAIAWPLLHLDRCALGQFDRTLICRSDRGPGVHALSWQESRQLVQTQHHARRAVQIFVLGTRASVAGKRPAKSGRTRRQACVCDLQQLLPEFWNHERHHDGCDSSWPRKIGARDACAKKSKTFREPLSAQASTGAARRSGIRARWRAWFPTIPRRLDCDMSRTLRRIPLRATTRAADRQSLACPASFAPAPR